MDLRGDGAVDGLGLEFGETKIGDFFLFWVAGGIHGSLEFLDRVLMVLFVMSFGGVHGGRGSAVDSFLQLLLFLISTSVESSKRKKAKLNKKQKQTKMK